MNEQQTTISTVRKWVQTYSQEELAQCMNQIIMHTPNHCIVGEVTDAMLNDLAKANFVKQLMAQGMDRRQAFRELGRRMRALSGESHHEP